MDIYRAACTLQAETVLLIFLAPSPWMVDAWIAIVLSNLVSIYHFIGQHFFLLTFYQLTAISRPQAHSKSNKSTIKQKSCCYSFSCFISIIGNIQVKKKK